MEIIDSFEQGTDEWFKARIGSIGGSSIAAVCAGGTGATRKALMYKLAAEILSGQKSENFQTSAMLQGIEREEQARIDYEFLTGQVVRQVALIRGGIDGTHCSPDGLVDDDGMIEIKCPLPHTHVANIDSGKVPTEYWKQMQWGLYIASRRWCDFVSYCPEIVCKPVFIQRVFRNEDTIEEIVNKAVDFVYELKALVERIRKES